MCKTAQSMKSYLPQPVAAESLTKHMKDEAEEFRCHTLCVYLADPGRRQQNLPGGQKKKKREKKQAVQQPLPDLLSAVFPFFLSPPALFFKDT